MDHVDIRFETVAEIKKTIEDMLFDAKTGNPIAKLKDEPGLWRAREAIQDYEDKLAKETKAFIEREIARLEE